MTRIKPTKDNPVIVNIRGKNTRFIARIPLWKAYSVAASIEKEKFIKDEDEKFIKNLEKKRPTPPKK